MPRRDPLTYDVEQRRTTSWAGLNPRLAILLIIVLAMAVVLVIWTARSAGPPPRSATPAHARPHVAASGRTASATPTASASAARMGSDAHASEHVPAGSRTAATQFVAAWLQRDPKARKSALQQTATAGLAEELMLTSPSNIPNATAQGDPALEHASEYSVQFVQTLTNRMRVRIYLVADPQARYGWVASSVEQA